jgi:hypothetical protein
MFFLQSLSPKIPCSIIKETMKSKSMVEIAEMGRTKRRKCHRGAEEGK